MKKSFIYILVIGILATGCRIFGGSTGGNSGGNHTRKPVIYLYPETAAEITVKVNFDGNITSTYPKYSAKGWHVKAKPDGSLINLEDGSEHYYLFWEGQLNYKITIPQHEVSGFVVKGTESLNFLKETLPKTGLTPKEYNDMIVYWLPYLQQNKYNFIHFLINEHYDQISTMDISPTPITLLRVFMVYQKLDEYQKVAPQVIKPTKRQGFTVVEWGGDVSNNIINIKPKS